LTAQYGPIFIQKKYLFAKSKLRENTGYISDSLWSLFQQGLPRI